MKISDVKYINYDSSRVSDTMDNLSRYLQCAAEFGRDKEAEKLYDGLQVKLSETLEELQKLCLEAEDPDEPDDLGFIRASRPDGPRVLCAGVPEGFSERLRGALLGRLAGCTLGAALEFQSVDDMKAWAEYFGDSWPLTDYWSRIKYPGTPHYIVGRREDLTKSAMNAVPPDDDIMYTLLGMLCLETAGTELDRKTIAETYKRYMPIEIDGKWGCYWGERMMVQNLLNGLPVEKAGFEGNPNLQNIAAWTRADAYGYAFAGKPERAAEFAWLDASMNHRRNGVYGSMFMAATIAAAFCVDDLIEAVRIGLTEIPETSLFAEGVRWALENPQQDYRAAHDKLWARYKGMFIGSALTNALHVVMGLQIAGRDFTKAIGETIAMSGDNDCTGATAGSICGAVIGSNNIPDVWTNPFHGRMHVYLREFPEYVPIDDICKRFEVLAARFADV